MHASHTKTKHFSKEKNFVFAAEGCELGLPGACWWACWTTCELCDMLIVRRADMHVGVVRHVESVLHARLP